MRIRLRQQHVCKLQGGGGGVEGWQDVGGLADVRAALQEALELPTKYAALIARSPSCHVQSCTCSIASLGFLVPNMPLSCPGLTCLLVTLLIYSSLGGWGYYHYSDAAVSHHKSDVQIWCWPTTQSAELADGAQCHTHCKLGRSSTELHECCIQPVLLLTVVEHRLSNKSSIRLPLRCFLICHWNMAQP